MTEAVKKEWKYKDYLESGKKPEEEFLAFFKEGKMATKWQNIKEHWDVWCEKYGYVDVKGMKKISRFNEKLNENIHWVELKNVLGDKGWAWAEKVNHFAFQTEDYFIVVEKTKLQKLISEKCKDKKKAKNAQDALYKIYRREGRKDAMTLVKTIDLIYICEDMIERKK